MKRLSIVLALAAELGLLLTLPVRRTSMMLQGFVAHGLKVRK